MSIDRIKQVKIIVTGIVQGVFYRAYTRDFAQKLGVKGTVRNLQDGSVEIVAEGEEEKLLKLIGFAKKGSPSSKVYNVDVEWKEPTNDFLGFKITF